MAGTIRCISRMSLGILTNNVTRQFICNGSRMIYTENSLGLTEYKNLRETLSAKYKAGADAFRAKMESSITDEKEMIFTEDLKVILHLMDKTPEDVKLLQKMIEKYNGQSSNMSFGTFKFGPIVMRTFHYLNEPDAAFEMFLNPTFDNFFNQLTSFTILLDLLYKNGRYKEVREAYDKIKTIFVNGTSHPKVTTHVVIISCYKENTPESLEYGRQICKDINDRGNIPIRRIIATMGALAIRQNAPHIALEITALCKTTKYITIRCVRVMALADLDRVDDIVLDFQSSLKRGLPEINQYYIDVVDKVEAAMKRLNLDENSEIYKFLQLLKNRQYINTMTLEEHISMPIETLRRQSNPMRQYEDQGWSNIRRRTSNDPRFESERKNMNWG